MRRLRTIRQHRRRANAGQVAAVATILGLLIVVTFISVFVIQPLPAQMGALEYQHELLVENQLARLQATVLAEAKNPNLAFSLSAPITLGSGAIPPWAGPSTGSIQPEDAVIHTQTFYDVGQVFPAPPNWNTGSNCLLNGSGKCASNGNIDTWNVTNANNTAFDLKVTGNSNSVQYNISGNNDTITIDWIGGDTGFVQFIINGSGDTVIYNKGGSDTTSPTANFLFYGQNDTFDMNMAGSHSSKGGITVNVQFVGELNQICPFGNQSNTDRLGSLGSGGSNLAMNVQWWNAVGYASAPHTVPYPGGAGSNESITFKNLTGVIGCAFTKAYVSGYTSQYLSGIRVHLYNHYLAPMDLVYDQGAVIGAAEGGGSIMVSPPPISYFLQPAGIAARIMLVNFVGGFAASAGVSTSAVTTQVIAEQAITITNGQTNFYITTPVFLNITTPYPQAWVSYFQSQPKLFSGGVSCVPLVSIPSPFTCLSPPPGMNVLVSAGMTVQQVTITTVTLAVSVA